MNTDCARLPLTIERLTTGVVGLDELAKHRDLSVHLRRLLRHVTAELMGAVPGDVVGPPPAPACSAATPPRSGGPGGSVALMVVAVMMGLVIAGVASDERADGSAGAKSGTQAALAWDAVISN